MSKDSFIEQLASFDFNAPVEVNIIFEDEEDAVSTYDIDIKQENTSEEERNTNDNSNEIIPPSGPCNDTNIKTENNLSPITKQNKESEEKYTNKDSNTNVKEFIPNTKCYYNEVKEKKKTVDKEIAKILKTSIELKTKPNHNNDHTATIPDINDKNKRKLEEDISYDSNKFPRVSESKCSRKGYEFPGEGLASFQPKAIASHNNAPNVAQGTENSENSSNTEMTCIVKLLQSVSKHLILIIDAHSKYTAFKAKNPKNCPETAKAWDNFVRFKYYLFNLSFCTVDSIILPQEKNIIFTGNFLNDTIKLAATKKLTLCLETQIAPLFLELLEWTKQNKLRFNSAPIETESNVVTSATHQPLDGTTQNHPLLNQQLKSPPKHFTNTGPMVQTIETGWNTCVSAPQHNIVNGMTTVPNFVANNGPTPTEGSMNRHHHQLVHMPAEYGGQNNQHQNKERNLNRFPTSSVEYNTTSMIAPQRNQSFNYNAVSLPKSDLTQVQSPQSSNLRPNKAQCMPHNRTEIPKSIELFSKGPPGREVSISLPVHQIKPGMVNTHLRTEMPLHPPTYEETLRASQNYQMYSRQNPQMTHHNFLNKSNIQSSRSNQNTIAAVEQSSQNYNKGNQIYNQVGQPPFQQSMASNSYVQSNVPQGYQITGTTQPWQQGTFGYIRSIDPKQMLPPQPVIQIDHQNQEMARSGSTDSGFMSPLNFCSPETAKDATEENSMLSSPMITHVTSLNPQVQYIKEGSCCICNNKTRKMCNGCYRKYYCSLECQRADWNVHRSACGDFAAKTNH